MDTSIKAILEANRQPENFVCNHCGGTKYQNQSDTQRKGWPVCHWQTMVPLKARAAGGGE